MANLATVTEISGRAWVRQPDGSLTELNHGDVIAPQSEVVTTSGTSVTLAINGAAPITIGEDRSVAITDALAIPADPSAAAVTPPSMTDSERLLAALESGDDPFGILEATAAIAGGPGGDDDGGSFVRLLRVLEPTTPLDLAYSRPGRAEAELPRLSGDGADGNADAPLDTTPPTGGTQAGSGGDVIVGDVGGMNQNVAAGTSYNIALLLDVSTTMEDAWGTGNPRPTRIDTAKAALKSLLENHLVGHDSNINVALITFPDGNQDISIVGLNAGNLQSILDTIDGLVLKEGGTPYGFGFNQTKAWFDKMGTEGYGTYENMTFFLTDSDPNHGHDDSPEDANFRNSAFAALKQVSPTVLAIGIGSGVSQDTLNRFDTTNVVDTVVENPIVADFDSGGFNGNAGLNNINSWDREGGGIVTKTNGGDRRLRMMDTDPSDAPFIVTMKAAHKMTVTDGAYFRFDARSSNWSNDDVFTWRLLKWDANANGGQGDWVTVESGDHIALATTTSAHGAGDYRFQFALNDRSPGGGQACVDIDNIQINNLQVSIGQAQIVLNPNDLESALVGGSTSLDPVPVGDDILYGQGGDDILYGGAGDDTFRWLNGDAGTVNAPAHDVIKDFGLDGADANKGNDKLDLRDLLQVEQHSSDLSQYLNFSFDGTDTVLKVSSTGSLQTDGSGYDQMITLEGVDLTGGLTEQNAIIHALIAAGKLLVDPSA